MIALLGLAIVLAGAQPTPPGTLLTIPVSCTYQSAGATSTTQAVAYMAVGSPANAETGRPVFLCCGYTRTYSRTVNKVTTTYTYTDTAANGRLVRCLQKAVDGSLTACDGIQLNDGRVLANGVPITPYYY